MAAPTTKPAADTTGEHAAEHAHAGGEQEVMGRTVPLILLWLPMLLVVGLMILTGVTGSHFALAGALVGLLVMTFAVVSGTVRLASLPPEEDDEQEEQEHVREQQPQRPAAPAAHMPSPQAR